MAVSLVDLLNVPEPTITVAGMEFECRSLTMGELAGLLKRFPSLGRFMGGGGGNLADETPAAIGAVIAIGTGHGIEETPGFAALEEEQAAAKLPLDRQLPLLEAVMQRTMPTGIVPFVERLTILLGVSPSASAGKGPATSLPPPSSS